MSGIESTPVVEGQSIAQQPNATEPQKPHVQADALPPDALKARIDAAKATGRTEVLRELGVTDTAQLKAALESIAAAEAAKKTEAEKFAELSTKAQQQQARLTQYEQAVATVWEAEAAKLTAEQSKAVTDIAGDDVALRVRTLNVLRPTWASANAQVVATTPAVTVSAPANTSPAPNAPTPTTTSPSDPKAQHALLLQKNPVAAANYAAIHPEVFS